MKRQYQENILLQHEIPKDLYYQIALFSDMDALKNLALVDHHFYQIYDNSSFWNDKVRLDYPFIINPNDDTEIYDINSYESITASWNEAEELIENEVWVLLSPDVPWFIDLDTYSIYKLQIKFNGNHYIVDFQYFTDDGVKHTSRQMTKYELLKLLTNLIYNQHVRSYGVNKLY